MTAVTASRGQARPLGRDPGTDGDPALSARLLRTLFIVALGLAVQGLVAPAPAAPAPPADAPAGSTRAPAESEAPEVPGTRTVRNGYSFEFEVSDADRDSLMTEIRKYSSLIGDLRDSLTAERGEIRLSPADRERLERSIGEFSRVIEGISRELGRMDFRVRDNTISLLDEAGEGIVITIPENLDEQLSEGFHALSEVFLAELPDTVRVDARRHLSFLGARPPRPPQSARKVIQGNMIKVWDDLLVSWGEDVRGHVVVVFGNCEVQGRIDGNVVVVFGNLQLGRSAEVTGQVVTVGGRLDQDEGAQAGDVVVVDPLGARRGITLTSPLGGGWQGFLLSQGLFMVMLTVALVAAVAAPGRRFAAVLGALRASPSAALGVGVLTAVVGHLVVLVLIAVLVLTVIGIPLALLVWLALAVIGVVATAVAAAALGDRVCAGRDGGCSSRWLAVLVGMLLLHALSFAGGLLGAVTGGAAVAGLVSGAGVLVKIGAYLFGLGALASTRFGGGRRPAVAPAAAPTDREYSPIP